MIGITERGDAAINLDWIPWVESKKPAILITKDCVTLEKILNTLPTDSNIIIHCTITGHGGTVYEPNVPTSDLTLAAYERLVELYETDRVVLRIDPIFPTDEGIKIAKQINLHAKGRVRISFLDNYNHVTTRFQKANLPALPYYFHAPLELRMKIWEEFGKPEICGEPDMPCTGCVSQKDINVFNIQESAELKGQRKACPCLAAKTELLKQRGQCKHACIYCYWK